MDQETAESIADKRKRWKEYQRKSREKKKAKDTVQSKYPKHTHIPDTIHVPVPDSVEKAVESIENKGFYITEENALLKAFLDGYCSLFDLSDDNRFKRDIEITGLQIQYVMQEAEFDSFKDIIKKYLIHEMAIVKRYFEKKNDQYRFTTIKFTTNYENNQVLNCFEQYPHQDVSTDNYLFVIVVLSESVIATHVYGTLQQLNELQSAEEVKKFFTIPSRSLKRGQCFILRPSIIHAGPDPGEFQRDLMYLEFTGVSISNQSYNQTFVIDYALPDYSYKVLEELKRQRHWILPSDRKKNKKKIPIQIESPITIVDNKITIKKSFFKEYQE